MRPRRQLASRRATAAGVASAPAHRASTGERLNTAETTGYLSQALHQRRIRLTRQRRVIVQVMDAAEQHLDADQIFARAREIDPDVHLVTVYRTLDLLKKQGLIDELDLLHLRGDRHYYESHGPRDHIHVACLGCGTVREFESRLYEQLKTEIEQDFGMRVTLTRTEVGGYCSECLKKAEAQKSLRPH
jgi:Fur family ferric uptake transcriptional regulator